MTRQDRWTGGYGYQRYIGRWSHPVADRFLDWLAVPANRNWVDVGCGTGVEADGSIRLMARAWAVRGRVGATWR